MNEVPKRKEFWEYDILYLSLESKDQDKVRSTLNKWGEAGWELVSVTPLERNGISSSGYVWFKRAIFKS